jgi:hypothetical protein
VRALANIIGIVSWAGGIIMILYALVLGEASGSGALIFVGAALLITGTIIYRSATSKKCPRCAEREKYEAFKCKHCGHEFVSTAVPAE